MHMYCIQEFYNVKIENTWMFELNYMVPSYSSILAFGFGSAYDFI